MDYSLLIRYLFILTISIPLIVVFSYGMILLYSLSKKRNLRLDAAAVNEDVTILIPTHNEEKIIEKRIENIFKLDYPQDKIKVNFIDDSNDSTPKIIQKFVDQNKNFQLIRFETRMGYSPSIIAGLKASTTDLIILNEAGSFPRPDIINNMMKDFQDSRIGGVTGRSVIINTDENIGDVESLYLRILNLMRKAESNLDSTFIIKGEATAYKRELVNDIESFPGTGSIDTTMSFLVRKKGFKTIYDENVIFDEYAPAGGKDYVKQKTTRAANWVRNLIIFKEMILNPKYGAFGMITMPFNLIALLVFPFLVPLAIGLLIIGIIIDTSVFIWIAGIALIILIVALIFARKLLTLFSEIEISLLKAIYQIFFKKKGHDKIERVESTRRI